ncbi:MAG: baseplate J/gp47 family protein [Candidatus Subteraquimicrobiales bacterium]|nr:baseplate J/gp47 family protein [Candidatus Subteraquimicrobiales bacterium]
MAAPLRFRAPATVSKTNLKFYWTVPFSGRINSFDVPIGQIAQTNEVNPKQYLTTREMTLYKEQEYVIIPAVSRLTGEDTYVQEETLKSLEPGRVNVAVTNPEESWGGRDQEADKDLRTNAMIARFALEKGTRSALVRLLDENGLKEYDYNLVENIHGYGNFAIYIDTTVDEFVDSVRRALNSEKAAGIYMICEEAVPLDLNLNMDIKVAQASDLLPKERENLKNELSQAFIEFVDINGVGQKIMMSRAIHYIYQQLLDKYDMFDLHINPMNLLSQVDEDNNILLKANEVAKINEINIEISTELD